MLNVKMVQFWTNERLLWAELQRHLNTHPFQNEGLFSKVTRSASSLGLMSFP